MDLGVESGSQGLSLVQPKKKTFARALSSSGQFEAYRETKNTSTLFGGLFSQLVCACDKA